MKTYILIILSILCLPSAPLAQQNPVNHSALVEQDFAGTLFFLSSNWMEGREAGARGGFMVRRTPDLESEFLFNHGIDFEVMPIPNGLETEAQLVFAGYGISDPGQGYDDYKGLNVKNRIVVVLDGFPGHCDTTSPSWKKFGKLSGNGHASWEKKHQTAARNGAIALVIVSAAGHLKPYSHAQHNQDIVQSAMNAAKTNEQEYDDPEYALPGDTTMVIIPCIMLGPEAANQLFSETGIVLAEFEKSVATDLSPASKPLKEKRLRISVAVRSESVAARNVLGVIRGKDTTKRYRPSHPEYRNTCRR